MKNHNQPPMKLKLICRFNGTFEILKVMVPELNNFWFSLRHKFANDGNDAPLTLELVRDGKATGVLIVARGGIQFVEAGGIRKLVLNIQFVAKKSNGGFGIFGVGSEVGFATKTQKFDSTCLRNNLKFEEKLNKNGVSNHELSSDVSGDLGLIDEHSDVGVASTKTLNFDSTCLRNSLTFKEKSYTNEITNHETRTTQHGSVNSQKHCSKGFMIEEHAVKQQSRTQQEKAINVETSKKHATLLPDGDSRTETSVVDSKLQKIRSSDLEYIKEVGSGAYGTVSYGRWNGRKVAIKMLKLTSTKDQDGLVADLWKEAHTLGRLNHPNVIALYGVVNDGAAADLAVVTEYMINGSLKKVMQKKDRTIDMRKRVIIAMDAALGMEYLHENNIVHFDLKSDNLLVNIRNPLRPVCKIGDLGLCRIKEKGLVCGGVRGTLSWMAPELLSGQNKMVTEKVDVYSFGIVLWELLTGEEPYNVRSEDVISGIINGRTRPEVPSWCNPGWRSLMGKCWSTDPDSRPSFSDITKELRSMLASLKIKY